MITTIYNILNIIFTSYLFYTGDMQSLHIWYTVMCIGAVFISFRIDKVVRLYPLIGQYYKEGVEILCGEEYKSRLVNYIGSTLCHLLIVWYFMNSLPLSIAVLAVGMYRIMILSQGHSKVKTELTKND